MHLRDGGDHPPSVRHARHLQDEIDGGGDLFADGAHGELEAGHEDHRLEAADGVARGVGVHRGHRAFVAGVHGLEHVQRLGGTTLADDDPIGSHAQGVLDQLADGDLASALG